MAPAATGDAGTAALIALLADDRPAVRTSAVMAIGQRLDSADAGVAARLARVLTERLEDERDPEVRDAIARLLLPGTRWALRYGEPRERLRAAEVLVRLSATQPGPLGAEVEAALAEHLREEPRRDLRRTMRVQLIALKAARLQAGRRPGRLRRLAAIVRAVRLRAGWSRRRLAERAGVKLAVVEKLESARLDVGLRNHLKVWRALVTRVRQPECVAFYERWNPELLRLPWYQRACHRYLLRLPEGVALEELLALPLAALVERRMGQLGLPPWQVAARSGLSRDRLYRIMRRRIKPPDVEVLARLAAALELDPSVLYLVAHREIPSFVPLALSDEGPGYLRPRPLRFGDAPLPPPPRATADVGKRLLFARLGLAPGARYASAIVRFCRHDPATDEVFVELPAGEAERLDLRAALARRTAELGLSQRAFFAQSPISPNTFLNVALGRSIPSERHLAFLHRHFGSSEAGFLYRSLRQRCGERIVARYREL